MKPLHALISSGFLIQQLIHIFLIYPGILVAPEWRNNPGAQDLGLVGLTLGFFFDSTLGFGLLKLESTNVSFGLRLLIVTCFSLVTLVILPSESCLR